ncbi:MAG: TetR/AcrR family transcriptional regulator [Gemmatimonadaceae bacterium]|nr:TetR/AcrR family transcriptional regulator [Gemmatimonadaceae bacterium]NUO95906.1 TetR/AcrR family transcriptional regulator [Gemmatimonadaceae bacterium]NUP54987.1 TetR/AcrR family transcriptional regulator [Gemmatimonadaceae bacterium]NUP71353.1 TetR/AcrR family transcriptional regulator [Gemmatimonadaceae bacterium]NUR33147.1 TetR/AcrR family transcriptional regulator [Gemmatimonadaceae bacterium]
MTSPAASPTPKLSAGAAARARIVDAAIQALVRDGATNASMSVIAAAGGVSKALLHYHYSDRAHLLAEAATELGRRLVARERAAIDVARGSGAVDAHWEWLSSELTRGELRALLELGVQREAEVREAAESVAVARARAATQTVTHLFGALGLTPRMPAALLAGTVLAFVDGLAIGAPVPMRDPRASFDLFWLALLSFAE